MNNIPEVKVGIVAVSRDCFPESLSVNRREALVKAYTDKYGAADIYECPICIVESEIHMVQALEDIKKAGCNALCVYLGNFGPEISETLLAKHFEGPKMFVAAAEETQDNLIQGRGDAYCGMLNASYNLKLRNVHAYIPEYPVGDAADCADMIHDFLPIARTEIGLSDLETMLFGFAGDWYYNKNKESKQAFFDVFEYAMQQGFAFGSGLGTNHHYGYQIRDIYKAAWMMRDLLKEETPLNKNIRRTLAYWSGLAETRIPYQYGRDELLDSWNTLLTAKVISALIQPDMRDQVRSMKALSRWVSGSLGFTPGTIGGIKVDGTTFHHGGLYPAYSIGAFATIGKYLELTNHTEFTISDDAARNVKLALQTMRNYCNLKDWGLGIAGRHPFDGSISNDAVQTFALLADRGDLTGSGNKIDEELAADYLRLNRTSSPYKRKFEQAGIKAASSPQGFF